MPTQAQATQPAPHTGSSAEVEEFLARLVHPLKPEILALRAIIRTVDPHIAESIKWNAPSFSTSEHFATFHLRNQTVVQVVLHLGVKSRPDTGIRGAIDDPLALLQWRGDDRATMSFRDLQEIETKQAALAEIIRQWIAFVV